MRQFVFIWMVFVIVACAGQPASPTTAPVAPTTTVVAQAPALRPTLAPTPLSRVDKSSAPVAPTRRPATGPLPPGGVLYYQTTDNMIWAASSHGSDSRPLVAPAQFLGARMAWSPSPDGRALAVVVGTALNRELRGKPQASLLLYDTQGVSRKLMDLFAPSFNWADLDPTAFGTEVGHLAWSPDGRRLAVSSRHEGDIDLYVVEVETGKILRLTRTPLLERDMVWGPDGQWLAYQEQKDSLGDGQGVPNLGLKIIKTDGTAPPVTLAENNRYPGSRRNAVLITFLIWAASDVLLWAPVGPVVGALEFQRATVRGEQSSIFAGPFAQMAWNPTLKRLAIASPFPVTEDLPKAPAPGLWLYGEDQQPTLNPAVQGPVDAVSWAPGISSHLVYITRTGAREYEVFLRRAGVDTKLEPTPLNSSPYVAWSPNGERVAVNHRIYHQSGQVIAELPDAADVPVAWGAGGLIYASSKPGQTVPLSVWDGSTTRLITDRLAPRINSRQLRTTIRLIEPTG